MNATVEQQIQYSREEIDMALGPEFVNKLRADFKLVAMRRRGAGEWSKEDEREIGESIRSAIDTGNKDMVVFWGRHIADLAQQYVGLEVLGCAVVARMRNQARLDREAREAAEAAAKAKGGKRV